MRGHAQDEGFSLIEVMIAMVISGIAFIGAIGAVQISSGYSRQGALDSRALELAQARLEVKQSVRWPYLLEDDLDEDGIPETMMKDDGQNPDAMADDGIYTAMLERNGITVVWSVEADRPGPLGSVGMVAIRAVSSYAGQGSPKEVMVATLRANPAFVGQR
ncbi:MAG: prepilin-type N-terminal cleavage/methylation domain-containing protein [Nitrospira sp.]|nr:prepilin-type N-terminal cleavage/methylation domain-containing protein [Nitrospira sp.]MBH0181951.1 prepilin-type N-terminal cleavage/methylation domain-containing protein [Nitrospira sp.]MBH0184129.1 prepilin-type N-terminal cleavage/methylation domain-containing protein [Nitrospira sp.]MBH0195990.1 prepilin-type N-terminal cleavage/methylation domain-containing protein [Nitrospira sp.]